jgi:hypothetical protein
MNFLSSIKLQRYLHASGVNKNHLNFARSIDRLIAFIIQNISNVCYSKSFSGVIRWDLISRTGVAR